MSLLSLPAELRLRIYDELPDFNHSIRQNVTISSGHALTPALSRTNRLIRRETLPLYARNSHFAIPLEEQSALSRGFRTPLDVWLDGLGETGVSRLHILLLSQHWKITQPTRWQTHVGFYLRLEHGTPDSDVAGQNTGWKSSIGTYPIAKDIGGMRLESVELLQRHFVAYLAWACQKRRLDNGEPGSPPNAVLSLTLSDFTFIVEAMKIVARHPISTYDLDQDQQGRQSRRGTFVKMEGALRELGMSYGLPNPQQGTFYTPY